MINLFKSFVDFIFPSRCPYCGRPVNTSDTLCPECFHQINFITAPFCKICGKPFENQKDIGKDLVCPNCASQKHLMRFQRSAIIYDDFSKKAILAFKFSDKTHLSNLFAKWLYLAGSDIFEAGVNLIIPVPLSYQRLISRRYNQAALLALSLSKLTHIKTDVTLLRKIKHTKPQSSLNEKARLKNIKNAFVVKNPTLIKDKRIVLIDDVTTTGATVIECAKVLIKAGAKSVDTLTVARTLKR